MFNCLRTVIEDDGVSTRESETAGDRRRETAETGGGQEHGVWRE